MPAPTTDPDSWTRDDVHAWLDYQLEPVCGPLTRSDLWSISAAVAGRTLRPRKGEDREHWSSLLGRVFEAINAVEQA